MHKSIFDIRFHPVAPNVHISPEAEAEVLVWIAEQLREDEDCGLAEAAHTVRGVAGCRLVVDVYPADNEVTALNITVSTVAQHPHTGEIREHLWVEATIPAVAPTSVGF